MKLITVHYLGYTAMDRRFSNPMLPWIVSEIRKRDCYERVSLGVEDGMLQAYNADFELQFTHNLQQMSRFSQADIDPCTFLYIMRDDDVQLLYCYLFQAIKSSDVSDLYQQMKDYPTTVPTRSLSSAASLTSLSVDISPSSSNFIEVLYIGKIKVWHKKVPDTFIDDALEKFKAHDLGRRSSIEAIKPGASLIRRRSMGSSGLLNLNDSRSQLIRSTTLSTITVKTPEVDKKPLFPETDSFAEANQPTPPSTPIEENPELNSSSHESQDEICDNVSPTSMSKIKRVKFKTRSLSESNSNLADEDAGNGENKQNAAYSSDSEASGAASKNLINSDDHNRTMVLQVGRADLRLISPDRKVVLLHKQNRDIKTCAQGIINSSHFGFICQEGTALNTNIGYVFKCESHAVASEAVQAISQSLANTTDSRHSKAVVTSCEHCPMVWYHRLCAEVEHLTDRKTQAAIFRRIDQLDEEEQSTILTKFRGAETDSLREQNEFLMMLLRAHCEMKQGRHVHDTAENRSEFLNHYLGGSTIFTKARRTLTNSFDNLLKRKASKDDLNPALVLNLAYRESSPLSQSGDFSDRESDGFRSRSSTVGSQSDIREARIAARENMGKGSVSPDKTLKSPMMDIFLKVGSTPKSADCQKLDSGSWRQAIFKRVIESNKNEDTAIVKKRSSEELRLLWKKSIHQAILLVRMEKENAKIRAQQEENAVKRIKLEYDEMKSTIRDVVEVWDLITSKESRVSMKVDNKLLLQAIHQGIPRSKRGEVWLFLAENHSKSMPPADTTLFPNYNIPYENLLKQLTSHQHAILIDLGRTFPSHSYFSSSLGPGQLALFNLLKAYSLLDSEVGYCQGLSFVAGVLLLHMEESQAFYLLRHLMFRRGLRKQYLPDMVALQVKLYQLSRLVHDLLPDLYEHFDFHEVSPTLYAAPWLLTLFASQFPLGFVTRVFDVLFLDNTDVIFKVAIALLSLHKEVLLRCDTFEEIMNYLKIQLPALDKDMLEKVMKEVSTIDIAKQLNEYQVEYQVLQEEMTSVQPQVEALHKLEDENQALKAKNKGLTAQLELAQSNILRLEKNRTLQQASINRLETQNRGLEVTITTLGNFISTLIDEKADIDIPGDVRRIISQITFSEKRKTDLKNPQNNNLMSMFKNRDKVMVKSLSTGRINLNELHKGEALRSNSLNPKTVEGKTSQFFSNSHNQILQQKLYPQMNPVIDITVQDYNDSSSANNVKSMSDCASVTKHQFFEEKSVSLSLDDKLSAGLNNNRISPTNSTDSGIVTPSSPRDVVPHPLSNCDVQFTFNGTRELKNIKSLKNIPRNSSPDMLAK